MKRKQSSYIEDIHEIRTSVSRKPGKVFFVRHRTQKERYGFVRSMMPWVALCKTVEAIKLYESLVRQMDLREPIVEFGRIDPVHPRFVLVRLGLIDRLCERSVGFRVWPAARGVVVGVVVTRLVSL